MMELDKIINQSEEMTIRLDGPERIGMSFMARSQAKQFKDIMEGKK